MVARRFALLAALVAASVAVLVPATAPATSSYSTQVIVSLRTPAFHGTLKSGRSACATGRTVKLYRVKSGPDKLLGTDRSDATAKWSIPIGKKRLIAGSYYAKAPAKGRCKPGKSTVLPVAKPS
jgi:hypothetical protein